MRDQEECPPFAARRGQNPAYRPPPAPFFFLRVSGVPPSSPYPAVGSSPPLRSREPQNHREDRGGEPRGHERRDEPPEGYQAQHAYPHGLEPAGNTDPRNRTDQRLGA